MKKKTMSFMFALALFVFSEIGVTPCVVAAGTSLTPQGIEFPDGSRQNTAARKWSPTSILVSPKATPAESGTALRNTLDAIDDASSSKPYLLLLEPGEYYLASYPLQMKSYVDIQGSGENVTLITGVIANEEAGVVQGKDNAELRFVTVKNKGGFGYYANAIYNDNASPSLLHVTVEASGGTQNRGIYNQSSSPTMTHVTVLTHGGQSSYGIHNELTSNPKMTHVKVEAFSGTANCGVYNNYSSPKMNHVIVEGEGSTGQTGYGVYNENSYAVNINHSIINGSTNSIFCISGLVFVGNTQLKGGQVYDYNGTSVKCAGIFDEAYTFYPSSCP